MIAKTMKNLVSLINRNDKREQIFDPQEISALIKYASEQGMVRDDLVPELFEELRAWEQAKAEDNLHLQQQATRAMLSTYTHLTRSLDGVNGRTLIHGRRLVGETRLFMATTFVFFLLSVGSLAMDSWIRAFGWPSSGWIAAYGEAIIHVITYFTPFFWGALGAGVYILKRVTDAAAENLFDPDKFRGWLTRLTLGGILGGIITYVIDPGSLGTVELSLTAVAFLTGLGTRVVYGALMRLLQILSDKLNLESLRARRFDRDPISAYIAEEISRTNPATEPERYQILTMLLSGRSLPTVENQVGN